MWEWIWLLLSPCGKSIGKTEAVGGWRKIQKHSALAGKGESGEKRGLTPFQSLLPDYHLSGNRNQRLPAHVARYLHDYLHYDHGPKRGMSDSRSYIAYKVGAKEQHPNSDPASWATFWNHLKKVPGELLGEQRGGQRLANSKAAAVPVQYRGLKPSYAWRTASVDHYTADIFVIIFSGGDYVYAARPTITGMIDIYSGAVISMSMSLLPLPGALLRR